MSLLDPPDAEGVAIDPAAIELPPTQPIDITALLRMQSARD